MKLEVRVVQEVLCKVKLARRSAGGPRQRLKNQVWAGCPGFLAAQPTLILIPCQFVRLESSSVPSAILEAASAKPFRDLEAAPRLDQSGQIDMDLV